jgi:hypothetical protein
MGNGDFIIRAIAATRLVAAAHNRLPPPLWISTCVSQLAELAIKLRNGGN